MPRRPYTASPRRPVVPPRARCATWRPWRAVVSSCYWPRDRHRCRPRCHRRRPSSRLSSRSRPRALRCSQARVRNKERPSSSRQGAAVELTHQPRVLPRVRLSEHDATPSVYLLHLSPQQPPSAANSALVAPTVATALSSGLVSRALGGPVARAAIDVGQPHEPEGAQPPREGTTQLLPEQRGGRALAADHPCRARQRALRRRAAVPGADARAQSVEQPRLDDELLREVRHEVRRKPLQRRRARPGGLVPVLARQGAGERGWRSVRTAFRPTC